MNGPVRLVAVWESEIDPLVIIMPAAIVIVGVLLYLKKRGDKDASADRSVQLGRRLMLD